MSRHLNPDDFERGIIEESEHDSKPRKYGNLRSFSPLNGSRAGVEQNRVLALRQEKQPVARMFIKIQEQPSQEFHLLLIELRTFQSRDAPLRREHSR